MLADLAQNARLELGATVPIFLVEIGLPGQTLYFSDRDFPYLFGYQQINYEGFVKSIQGLGQGFEMRGGQLANQQVRIELANSRWGSYPYLFGLNAAQPFTRGTVTIYRLELTGTGETVRNKIRNSETLAGSTWNNSNATRLDNQIISPRGDMTGALITAIPGAAGGLLRNVLSGIPVGTPSYFSVWVKKGNYRYIGIRGVNYLGFYSPTYTFFDFDTQVLQNADLNHGVIASGIEDAGGGWFRLWIAGSNTTANVYPAIILVGSNGASLTATGSEYFYIWGAHGDTDTYRVSAYLPTLGQFVSRQMPYEAFRTDARSIAWKGCVEGIAGLTRSSFVLNCGSRSFSKRFSLGLKRITRDLDPLADQNEVGMFRNLPVGALEYVPARLVKTGAVDILMRALSKSDNTIQVCGAATMGFQAKNGRIQIDTELIDYVEFSNDWFIGCTRGSGGSKPSTHSVNVPVFQVIDSTVYEVSQVPIKSIDAVRVGDFIQTGNYEAYTGQPGNTLAGYPGRAVLRFPVQPIVQQQFNLNVTVNDGSHTHDFGNEQTSQKNGASHSQLFGTFLNPANMYDGDQNSWGQVNYVPAAASKIQINLAAGGSGAISKVDVHIKWRGWLTTGGHWAQVKFGNAIVVTKYATFGSVGNPITETYTLTDATKFDWSSSLTVETSSDFGCQVYDIYAVYYFSGVLSNVDTVESLYNTIQQGLTVADIIMGAPVSVDLQGPPDDSTGTYTGAPGALIEQPDHVFKFMLMNFAQIPASDFGASFALSGTSYAAKGYKFAFLAHDLGTKLNDILDSLAMQCRSVYFEWAGKFELIFLPDAPPAAGFVAAPEDILTEPTYEFSSVGDIQNHLNCFYRRDYRDNSGRANALGTNPQAVARGYMDFFETFFGPADIDGDLLLNAIRLYAMARDVAGFWTNKKGQQQVTVSTSFRWRGWQAGPGQSFQYTDSQFGTVLPFLTGFQVNQDQAGIDVTGVLPFLTQGWGSGAWGWQPWGS